MYVDGSFKINPKDGTASAQVGGYCIGPNKEYCLLFIQRWAASLYQKTDLNPEHVEMFGCYKGMTLADEIGIRNLDLNCANDDIVKYLNSIQKPDHTEENKDENYMDLFYDVARRVRQSETWRCDVNHIPKGLNKIANYLSHLEVSDGSYCFLDLDIIKMILEGGREDDSESALEKSTNSTTSAAVDS